MPRVSELLKEAREMQSLSVQQVAEVTKIKSEHVRALDEGNYDAFTAPVYIKGFVRSYANLLKLDVPSILATLDQELSENKNFAEPPALIPRSRSFLDILMYQLSKVKWRILLPVMALALLALGVAYGIKEWQASKTRDPLSQLGNGLYQPSRENMQETLPLPAPAPSK
jgi:cytoskeletal protein RodZ